MFVTTKEKLSCIAELENIELEKYELEKNQFENQL